MHHIVSPGWTRYTPAGDRDAAATEAGTPRDRQTAPPAARRRTASDATAARTTGGAGRRRRVARRACADAGAAGQRPTTAADPGREPARCASGAAWRQSVESDVGRASRTDGGSVIVHEDERLFDEQAYAAVRPRTTFDCQRRRTNETYMTNRVFDTALANLRTLGRMADASLTGPPAPDPRLHRAQHARARLSRRRCARSARPSGSPRRPRSTPTSPRSSGWATCGATHQAAGHRGALRPATPAPPWSAARCATSRWSATWPPAPTCWPRRTSRSCCPLPVDFTGDGELFMLRVRGDSMIDAGILDGDYVVAASRPRPTRATSSSPASPARRRRSRPTPARATRSCCCRPTPARADGVRSRRGPDLRPGRHRDAPPLTAGPLSARAGRAGAGALTGCVRREPGVRPTTFVSVDRGTSNVPELPENRNCGGQGCAASKRPGDVLAHHAAEPASVSPHKDLSG